MNDPTHLGKQAINEAQPCGADVRDEPEFDLLQNEIAKMSNPAASGTPDWNEVVRLCTVLLETKGKDVLVASYLTAGLLATRELDGLADGMQVLADLFDTWWEQLHPPLARLRARRNAVQWLIDRVRAHAGERDWSTLPPQDPARVERLHAALAAIDTVLAEKDSDAPSMQPLRTLLATVPLAEIAPVATAPQADVPATAPTPAAPTAPAGPGTRAAPEPGERPAATDTAPVPSFAADALAPVQPDSADAAERATGEALERLADVGAWYAETAPSNPSGFRLRRIGAWAGIERTPAAGASGDTALPGPIPPLQDALQGLVSRAAHLDLVGFAETQLRQHPFWLDLHCVAAQSLGLLGDSWAAARREVCNETAKFVARLPGIEQLKFANGVPFASADTLQWLQSLASPEGSTDAPAPDPLAAVLARARANAADGDLASAAQCVQEAIDRHPAVVARLRLRTTLCDLLLEHRPGARLDAFARAVVAEIDRFDVASWDAPLAADGLRAAYSILSRNDENGAETDALLARIAPLNVATAVRLIT